MDKEKYIRMCEAMGDEVDYEKMPPEYEDFPSYVHKAFDVFNSLPDTYSGGMSSIYVGKDLSALLVMFELHEVAEDERKLVFEAVQLMDTKARKQAEREAKKAARANK